MHYNVPGCAECRYLLVLATDLENVEAEDLPEEVYQLARLILGHSFKAHRLGLDKPDEA